MRAFVYEKYGPPEVLSLRELPRPAPKDDEVLIQIRAATVTSADWRARSLIMPAGFGFMGRLFFGYSRPRRPILGSEIAGTVVEVGRAVTTWKPGDQVFAFTGVRMGGHAEYTCVRASGALAHKPANLSWEEAAALSFGGTTALYFLRRAQLRAGETVLVNGASGAVGSAVVQLARHMGAEVTAVCSGANAELVRTLGAARVIDYHKEDFARRGERWDVIVDTVGTAPFARSKHALAPGGRLLLVLGSLGELLGAPWRSLTSGKKIIGGTASERAEDLRALATLAEQGHFRPFIDRRYPFERLPEAHAHVDTGHKRGNVVITL